MKTLLAIVTLASLCIVHGAESIKVSTTVIGSGTNERHEPVFALECKVTNGLTHSTEYAIMTCNWADSIRLAPKKNLTIRGWGCDGNFVTRLVLNPSATVVFQFQVVVPGRERVPERIKVGFALAPWPTEYMFNPGSDPKAPVAWSEWIDLPQPIDHVLDEDHSPLSLRSRPNQPPQPTTGLAPSRG